jgi:hypothetical protein
MLKLLEWPDAPYSLHAPLRLKDAQLQSPSYQSLKRGARLQKFLASLPLCLSGAMRRKPRLSRRPFCVLRLLGYHSIAQVAPSWQHAARLP